MSDLAKKLADINRRLLGLKADRPVSISQLDILNESWSFALSLGGLGNPDDEAIYKVTIVCAGDPIVDVAYDGFPPSVFLIVPGGIEWDITGNTAIAYVRLLNSSFSPQAMTLTIRAFALNGLSADIVRTF